MVGQGRKGDSMFHYVKDRDFLSRMKSDAADTVNRLVQRINNDGFMTVRSELVGSGHSDLFCAFFHRLSKNRGSASSVLFRRQKTKNPVGFSKKSGYRK